MYRTFLSWRWLGARRTNLVGIGGVFVGCFALILILSIMTGFLEESRRTVRGSLADVLVTPEDTRIGGELGGDPQPLLAELRADPRVAAASAQLVWGGILTLVGTGQTTTQRVFQSPTHGDLLAVQLIGVDVLTGANAARLGLDAATWVLTGAPPRPPVVGELGASTLHESLVREPERSVLGTAAGRRPADPLLPFRPPEGYAPLGRPASPCLVGEHLARSLGLEPGREIGIATAVLDPDAGEWKVNNLEFVVAGTFRSRDTEMDRDRIYVDRRVLADFLGGTREFSQILVRTHDYDADGAALVADLRQRLDERGLILGGMFAKREVATWEDFRGNLIGAIENERFLMGIMLSLVMLVAGFTIFAILSMMATEKRRDVGVLCALGATPRGVLQVFLLIAFWDALIGVILGTVFGVWAAIEIDAIERWVSATLGIQVFRRDLYVFDYIPSIVQPAAVTSIVVGAFLGCLLFAALPAWRAARLDPLDALRYE